MLLLLLQLQSRFPELELNPCQARPLALEMGKYPPAVLPILHDAAVDGFASTVPGIQRRSHVHAILLNGIRLSGRTHLETAPFLSGLPVDAFEENVSGIVGSQSQRYA